MKVVEIEAKSILVRSKLPDAEYVVNPYTGCVFGCHYCYASFAGRFVGEPIGNWGNYVYAKINAIPLFEVELARLRRAGRAPSILLSSVTDAYQGAEKKYRLTRGILDALFAGLARAGVRSLYVEHINLRPYIQQRMQRALRSAPPEVQAVYRDARTDEHRRVLDTIVGELLAKHGLTLRLSRVLYHQDL